MVYGSFENIDAMLEEPNLLNKKSAKSISDFRDEIVEVQNQFNDVLWQLQTHKDKLLSKDKTLRIPTDFVFSEADKNKFKDTDMWPELKQVYSKTNQLVPQYSGKVFKTAEFIRTIKEDKNPFLEEYKGFE